MAFFGVVAATLLACSEATRPAGFDSGSTDPRGSWTLVAVDGHPLPVPVDVGAEIVAGELELSADGSYWSSTHATISGVVFNDWWDGHWSAADGRIVLQRARQPAVFLGTWHRDTIDITATRTMRYIRSRTPMNSPAGGPTQPSRPLPR